MAQELTDRFDDLYVAAIDANASLMRANAVSATARWCGTSKTHAQVLDFVQRQIATLASHTDALSFEVQASWQWLAGELGAAPAPAPTPALGRSRMINFGRRERMDMRSHPSRVLGTRF